MSSEHLERSLSLRRAGYSCGQSVLIPYAAEFGLDEELASAMALPLAGGMAKGPWAPCSAASGGRTARRSPWPCLPAPGQPTPPSRLSITAT